MAADLAGLEEAAISAAAARATVGKIFMTRASNRLLNAAAILLLIALASCSSDHAPVSENQSLGPASGNKPELPQPQGFVNDFAGKLSSDTKQKLESLLSNFADKCGIEFAVVTIPFDELKGQAIEEFSLQLASQWGIGRGPDKLGLLLLVAIKPQDSDGFYQGATKLEVSRKLERDIPNDLASELILRMRDDFKSGRFDQALASGVQAILSMLVEKRGISLTE